MLIFQLFVAVVATVLDFGPLGRVATPFFSLSVGLVMVWAFCWFGQQRDAFRYALVQGLLYGLIGFTAPVVWIVIFVGAYFLIDLLKGRFFEVSSVLLALLTLAITSLWYALILGLAVGSFDALVIFFGIVTNCFAGAILYYTVGIRFKFLQRWAGRRL